MTVSYTHLDVYKRQVWGSRGINPINLLTGAETSLQEEGQSRETTSSRGGQGPYYGSLTGKIDKWHEGKIGRQAHKAEWTDREY